MNRSDIYIDTIILSPEGTSLTTSTTTAATATTIFSNCSNTFGFDESSSLNASTGVSPSLASTRFVVGTIITPIVVTVGLLGNVLNILVLVQPTMRTSTNVYLLTLAMADSVYLIFSFTLSFLGCRKQGLSYEAYAFNTYGRTISDMAGNIAVWIIVIFTVERYVAVCHPLQGKVWCTVKRAKLFSLLAALACVANTLPGFFELQIIHTEDGFRCDYTPFASSPAYKLGYTWWYVTIFTFLPFTFLLIFNSLLIHTVVRAARHRQQMLTDGARGDGSRTASSRRERVRFSGLSLPSVELSDTPASPRRSPFHGWRCPCCWNCLRAGDPQEHRRLCRQTFQMTYTGTLAGEKTWSERMENGCVHSPPTLPEVTVEEELDGVNGHTAVEERGKKHPETQPAKIRGFSRSYCGRTDSERTATELDADLALEDREKHLRGPSRLGGGQTRWHQGCDLLVDSSGKVNWHARSPVPSPRSLEQSPRPSPTHALANSSFSSCHRASEVHQSRRSREQHKVTLMLIVIVIIFLLCQLPWTVLYLYRAYLTAHDSSAAGSDDIKIAGNVVNLLAQVNASGNFYLYSFFSKRFRRTLARLFLFWRKELSSSSLVHL